ncbi:MAG: tetratricopeptide repeat protein, partial [Nitrospirales bacterium]
MFILGLAAGADAGLDPEQRYELNYAKGLVEFGKGRYEDAKTRFEAALEARPGDLDAAFYLGQTLIRLQQPYEAADVFRRLVLINPKSGRAHLGLGMALFNQADNQAALTTLDEAERLAPDSALVHYYQGLAYARLGAYEESFEPFARAMVINPGLAPEAQFQRGLAFLRQGDSDKARAEFQAVAAAEPESELGRSAKRYLERAAAAAPKEKKSWSLDLAVSSQWDSNVVLLPIGTQPNPITGISRKGDYRTALYARGELRPYQTDRWTVGSSYAVYRSFHRELAGFDVETHTPIFFVQHQRGAIQARLQYAFDYVNVGDAPFLHAHSAQATMYVVQSRRAFMEFKARYQDKDFQHGRFVFNSARDGKNWLAGATQYLLFGEEGGYMKVGYTFDADRTGGGSPGTAVGGVTTNADWAYKGQRASVGIGLPLMWQVKADASFDYYRQDYDNPNSFSCAAGTACSDKRQDDIYIVNATLSRDLTERLSLAAQYSYTRDEANLKVFNYNRSVYA